MTTASRIVPLMRRRAEPRDFVDTGSAVHNSCNQNCLQGRLCDCVPNVPEGRERKPLWPVRFWLWMQRFA
jgi:hypothetical protein